MSDIFREVEEDVRRERLEKWWKKYGDYVIAGVSVVIIAVAGFKLWQHYQEQQRFKASSEYESALQFNASGRSDQAVQAFAQVAKHAPGGYAALARLSQANALLADHKTAEAVAIYMDIANKDQGGLGDLARIRAAWAQADTLSTADLAKLLEPLAQSDSQWRYMAREILAYRAFRDRRLAEAQKQYGDLANAADAPASLRQRAKAMATLIRTGGGENYGSVPPPTPQPAGRQGQASP